MTTKNQFNDEKQILKALKNEPKGTRISKIEQLLTSSISRRTLLRRLASLEQKGQIQSSGDKRDKLYYLSESNISISLSQKALNLKKALEKPLHQRKPVTYNPDFLHAYKPNESFYLSEATRAHLTKIGRQTHNHLEPGTYVKRIIHRLLVDLSWNSSRLEGNTYSLLETKQLIEFGAYAKGKEAFETQMIQNHKDAIEFMIDEVNIALSEKSVVFNIHALLSNNLLSNPRARGRLRQIPVGINSSVYTPIAIPQLIEEYFELILSKANLIKDPFEKSFFLLIQLPYLQPFEDVNKRVSRLVTNCPLLYNNLSPLSFIDVPEEDYKSGLIAIYESNNIDLMKEVYLFAYERSTKQYQIVQDTLEEPNILYMEYKKELSQLVHNLVSQNIRGKHILHTIEAFSKEYVSNEHQQEFCRIAEKEIASLHEGNIAIYKISSEAFFKWQIK